MGDEIVAPDAVAPGPGQVRDINTYTVAGQVAGLPAAFPCLLGLVGDDYEAQLDAARRGFRRYRYAGAVGRQLG